MLGFLRADGRLTLETICAIRLNQPPLVCLENVPGLSEEPNIRYIVAMFKWAGFTLLHHECNDMSDISPATRRRWLSIWIRNDLSEDALPVKSTWFRARDFNIREFGVMDMCCDADVIQDFILDDQLMHQKGSSRSLSHAVTPSTV
eukprot:Skav223299  [mRNA]  locus=scaffold4198:9088:9525:- [translate_table: standard]